jgi:hypothetical protein
MKNISTGFGLCVLGLGIAAWPVLDRIMPTANASAVTAAAAVTTAATGQTAPTIVWYGVSQTGTDARFGAVYRAWSDGRIEMRQWAKPVLYICGGSSGGTAICCDPWVVINDPAQGLTFRSDINFDEKVDGADLATLLTDWGNAPRQDIPPSDCPLALINP